MSIHNESVVCKMQYHGILPDDVDRYMASANVIIDASISISSATLLTSFYAMDMIFSAIKSFKEFDMAKPAPREHHEKSIKE